MRRLLILSLLQITQPIVSQQIWDIWQTTWDRTKLFTSLAPSSPINFVTPGPIGDANIVVEDSTVYQSIAGFGASLTDSSALLLNNLKSQNAANYNTLLNYMFNSADGANAAGLNYIRVPIGASDFSAGEYSLDDTSGDTSFGSFSINRAPSYLFSVLQDIRAINNNIKVNIVPWSPPAWMKTTGTMNGGTIQSQYVQYYPTYLLKAVQGFWSKGIPIYGISIQNEPQNSNPTYPTCTLTPAVEGQIGTALRTLLNNNGLSSVKVIGYEHNWDNAGSYPITLMQDAGNSFAGVAFHCYAGSVSNQDTFHNAYPNKSAPARMVLIGGQTSGGLNAYAHAFLLNSGKMLVQANVSTMIWDYNNNVETYLPNMPGNVVRVYPASGAVAMLPLTPSNNWNPTVLFCGGNDMPEPTWGNYSFPAINTWDYPASKDCQRLTPEPLDGSAPAYEADDDMLEGRSMGQFIILPDGKMLVVNGALNGTAGYAHATGQTFVESEMPFGMSLASGPVGTPAIYDPNAPKGKRWSRPNFDTSPIARMYHSSAMLLPDGSVLIAGSNPNVDVNTTTFFNTEYRAEIFYPHYFSATTRPSPSGVPTTISYGGPSFDITITPSSYSGSSNAAAANTTVILLRGGFTTHAMNMGQRYVQLNNTYTVESNGTIVLHVAQAPNPNILQPGPALLFVVVNGIPSNGTMVLVGTGNFGLQPTSPPAVLPANILVDSAKGAASVDSTSDGTLGSGSGNSNSHLGAIIGGAVGAVAIIGVIAGVIVFFLRRRKNGMRAADSTSYAMTAGGQMGTGRNAPFSGGIYGHGGNSGSVASSFAPLHRQADSDPWNGSTTHLAQGPYRDEPFDPRARSMMSVDSFDPYASSVKIVPQPGYR